MDAKWAKGYTREGFRRAMGSVGSKQDTRAEAHRPFIEKLSRGGKLSKYDVDRALSIAAEENASSSDVVFFEKFVNGSPRSPSPSMDGVLVGANCWSAPLTIGDHEEKTLSYAMFYERFGRSALEYRILNRPIYIREHAVSRFIERADSPFHSVPKSLWPGILLIEALEHFDCGNIAKSFVLPTPQGVFLGVGALGNPPADCVGIERLVINRNGHAESVCGSSAETLIPIWSVNTFLSLDQLKGPQAELRSKLESIVDTHYNVLMVAHLSAVMTFESEIDTFGIEKRYFGSIEAAKQAFESLFRGESWLRDVRDPQGGIFAKHFVAQAMLERYDAGSNH